MENRLVHNCGHETGKTLISEWSGYRMPVVEERVAISIKKILLATDFSPISEKAAAWARALAHRSASRVELAHVFDPSVARSDDGAIIGLPVEERRRLNTKNLELLRNTFSAAGVEAQATLHEGHRPSAALLRLAKEDEIDLIVVGTQSNSEAARLMLGSTAEELIRNATCPVLTVGPKAAPPSDHMMFRTIVCATDLSTESATAARYALSFAEERNAHLYLVYISSIPSNAKEKTKLLDRAFLLDLKRMLLESSYDWCSPEYVVEHGDSANAIHDLATKVNADLIVLGARGSSFWLTNILRTRTPDLLAQAACPVMTV
jgi:nucleotide-binding universal stress UspA family protein